MEEKDIKRSFVVLETVIELAAMTLRLFYILSYNF